MMMNTSQRGLPILAFLLLTLCLVIPPFVGHAQLNDPIPKSIAFGDLNLVLEEWLTIQSSSATKPFARINMIREIPRSGGLMAVNDLNGPMYMVTSTDQIVKFFDLNKEFANFIPVPGKGTGFGAFAFHPDYMDNGLLYTAHSEAFGVKDADFEAVQHNGIALQWVVTKWIDNNTEDLVFTGTHQEMMRMDFPTQIHGIQDLSFNVHEETEGDDYGMLYICVGEGGSGLNKLLDNIQNLSSHLGTIFRIDPKGTNGRTGKYGIPNDNPFINTPNAYPEIWAYGFRNPHRLHFEKKTSEIVLYACDIGEVNIEELNIVLKAGNYGWSKREGTFLFDINVTRDNVFELPADDADYDYIYPVAQYDHDEGNAIVSGHIWNSDRVKSLKGIFLMGDIPNGRLFYAPMTSLQLGSQFDLKEARLFNEQREETTLAEMVGIARVDLRFGYDSKGEVFVMSKANAKIYRLNTLEQLTAEDLVAFPGAEGFGSKTSGGRGGKVLEVTNLNDSGVGSLRNAIVQNYARTIVFRVSGNIELKSELKIENGNLTIAGQTSPGGITVSGYQTSIAADNVILRFLKFRMGDTNKVEGDALSCRFSNQVIIDHCSFSWSLDETLSMYRNKNTSFQWNMVTESLNDSYHSKGPHGYGGIWGGDHASFHHNIVAHHTSRTPRLNGARFEPNWNELTDFRNNVIYNWQDNSVYGGDPSELDGAKAKINMVNNYYKFGPSTASNKKSRIFEPYETTGSGFSQFYIDGNFVFGNEIVSSDNWNGGVQGATTEELAGMKVNVPFDFQMNMTHDADEAFEYTLRSAGSSMPKRDVIDQRIVNEIASGASTFGSKGIIDSQLDVGGYPSVDALSAPEDSDHDGMPDSWETEMGLNPDNESDATLDKNLDGYTNLEEYLNSLVAHLDVASIDYLPQPKKLKVVEDNENSNSLVLTWNEYLVNSVQVAIERSIGDKDHFEEIGKTSENTYSDNVSIEDDSYVYYRIRAMDSNKESFYSQIESAYLRYVLSVSSTLDAFSIYPNPAKDEFYVKSGSTNLFVAAIHNLMGRNMNLNIVKLGNGEVKINAQEWSKGIYFVTIVVDGHVMNMKLVKH